MAPLGYYGMLSGGVGGGGVEGRAKKNRDASCSRSLGYVYFFWLLRSNNPIVRWYQILDQLLRLVHTAHAFI